MRHLRPESHFADIGGAFIPHRLALGSIGPYTPLSPEFLTAKVQDTLGPRLDNIEQKVGITLALAATG